MGQAQIGTVVFIIILFAYAYLLDFFIFRKTNFSYYYQVAIGLPGVLLLLALYGWFALSFSLHKRVRSLLFSFAGRLTAGELAVVIIPYNKAGY